MKSWTEQWPPMSHLRSAISTMGKANHAIWVADSRWKDSLKENPEHYFHYFQYTTQLNYGDDGEFSLSVPHHTILGLALHFPTDDGTALGFFSFPLGLSIICLLPEKPDG